MTYVAAARAVADLVRRIPHDAWDGPGLGEWSMRDLVGHTSRSLVTVIEYLARPAEREELTDPADYYVAAAELMADGEAVTERGRQAGRDLGDELVVHGMDIADAAGLDHDVPQEALEEATMLAARIAVRTARGQQVLLALTGRGELGPRFSVV
jgi:hypothetical protein